MHPGGSGGCAAGMGVSCAEYSGVFESTAWPLFVESLFGLMVDSRGASRFSRATG